MNQKIGYIILSNVVSRYSKISIEKKLKDLEENPPREILNILEFREITEEEPRYMIEQLFLNAEFREYCQSNDIVLEDILRESYSWTIQNFLYTASNISTETYGNFVNTIDYLDSYRTDIRDVEEKDIKAMQKTYIDRIKRDAEQKIRKSLQEVIDEEGYTMVFNDISMFAFIKNDMYNLAPKVMAKLS